VKFIEDNLVGTYREVGFLVKATRQSELVKIFSAFVIFKEILCIMQIYQQIESSRDRLLQTIGHVSSVSCLEESMQEETN